MNGRSGGTVDAAVSKTVGGQPPCRFESDLRHQCCRHWNVSEGHGVRGSLLDETSADPAMYTGVNGQMRGVSVTALGTSA